MAILWFSVVLVVAVIAAVMNSKEAKISRMEPIGKCNWCPGKAIFYVKIELKSGTEYGICCRDCYEVSMGRVRLTEEEIELYKVMKT